MFVIDTQASIPAGKPCLSCRSCLKETLLLILKPDKVDGREEFACPCLQARPEHAGDAKGTVSLCSTQRQTSAAFPEILAEDCLSLMSGDEIVQLCLWWELPVIYVFT